ncbi:hypothetical protein LTR22_027517 [Elasticomyces elasticus]|nr:hypothetical protein LTR22_027517 [Elasticomyces elasticus]KAK5733127.1 hypothetical protein LTS12_027004 [Elasticomyces elasticus]
MEWYLQPVGVLRQYWLRRQSAFEVLLRHPTSKLGAHSNGTPIKQYQYFRNNELFPAYLSRRHNEHCRNFILDHTGAKAGIGAACGAVGLAALIGIIIWFPWRKRRATTPGAEAHWQQEQQQEQQQHMLQTQKSSRPYGHASPQCGGGDYYSSSLATPKPGLPQEMAAQSPVELPHVEAVRGELVGDVPA